ncbi:TPA: hypothetical protein DEG75_02925 [Candidatus Dependentiae bacterium]|nr:hypothetical protein [Candidatus Dependentiae bacterium]
MIRKLFKLAGLAALLASACAPLSLKAMEVNKEIVDKISNKTKDPREVLRVFNTIKKENQNLYHDVIKDRLRDWIDWVNWTTDWTTEQNKETTNNLLISSESYFKACGMTDNDCFELLRVSRFLKNPKSAENTIKELITDTRNIGVVKKIYQAIPEKQRFLYKTVIEERFSSWISWALPRTDLGGAISNNTLETLFRNCDMSDNSRRKLLAERRFLLDDMTPTEIDHDTQTLQEIANSEKTTVSPTLTANATKGISRWFEKIQNKPLDCTLSTTELIKIDSIVNKYKIKDNTIISLLEELMLNAYTKEVKVLNDGIQSKKLFDSLPEAYKRLQAFEAVLNPPSHFDWLTNNAYFKPVAISLTVAAVGVIGFLMFKKFCPQYSAKISSKLSLLFKLPRLWSRTPKVSQLQHNFSHAI